MSALLAAQRQRLRDLSELTHANPFEPRRIELERALLGDRFRSDPADAWSRTSASDRTERPNVVAVTALAGDVAEDLCRRQADDAALRGEEASHYDDAVTYAVYYRHVATAGAGLLAGERKAVSKAWRAFRNDRRRMHDPMRPAERDRLASDEHLFACLHQVRRAFNGIFEYLIGESAPANRLRAAVWQSIFTHDLRRYRRVLHAKMGEVTTLITGPSGAGKELVARAIGHAQYWPFDPSSESFPAADGVFLPVNLSALSATLIESELFGHRKGSFTGAIGDRVGWLERCPSHGAVFLDEIGELDPAIQVKLLRVAQSRDYSRLGESEPRRFTGKIVAATNRDLDAEMRAGRFREDLYYRLCSDRVSAPSLADQLADRPQALGGLVRHLSEKVVGDAGEAEELAVEVERFIRDSLPAEYAWPGNIRELEQCVRSVLVRRSYRPPAEDSTRSKRVDWLAAAERGELTADELLDAYCGWVHRREGGYEPAARVLGIDRRTVKARVTRAAAE